MRVLTDINVNVVDTAVLPTPPVDTPPLVPNTGDALTDAVSHVTNGSVNHPAIVAILVTAIIVMVIAAIILFKSKHRRSGVGLIVGAILLTAIGLIPTTNNVVAEDVIECNPSIAACLSIEPTTITIDKADTNGAESITGTEILTTNVSSDNPTGYTMTMTTSENTLPSSATAKMFGNTDETMDLENMIDLTNLDDMQIKKTNAIASDGDETDFTIIVTVPSDIAVGKYTLQLTLEAENNRILPTAMQAFTQDDCASLDYYTGLGDDRNDEAVVTLTDARNNQLYNVAKLADGNCWMLNNLKLDAASITANGDGASTTLTSTNTNLTGDNTFTIPTISNPYSDTTMPGVHGPVTGDSSGTAGSTTSNEAIDRDDFYGYLYNWCAATGNDPATCTAYGVMPTDATQDICPANWRMPTGGADGEYVTLDTAMKNADPDADDYRNWQAVFGGAFRGVRSGYLDSTFDGQSSYGYIWSSTHYPNEYFAYAASFREGSGVQPDNFSARFYGFSVRCLLKQ
ncbi:MAG: fibrobacter succinogenes major paralogous domain-containing protein [Candidatus Nomurabacteria bacterium]|nr:fibrobacter succinogenes major paralogous domain-containing protein [Candidatus Nomurabacteria bacterium]